MLEMVLPAESECAFKQALIVLLELLILPLRILAEGSYVPKTIA